LCFTLELQIKDTLYCQAINKGSGIILMVSISTIIINNIRIEKEGNFGEINF